MKLKYATNNHSFLVCTETKKEEEEKKNLKRQSNHRVVQRLLSGKNISPIPECKEVKRGPRPSQTFIRQDGGSSDVSVVLDFFF